MAVKMYLLLLIWADESVYLRNGMIESTLDVKPSKRIHLRPFDNQVCIILWLTWFDLHQSGGRQRRELLGIIAASHRA